MDILIKDTLRSTIERASGGKQTVLYTAKNQPCVMSIIEKFDLAIDPRTGLGGTHPAFIVNGVQKDVIYIGTYLASMNNGELLSQSGVTPVNNQPLVELQRAAMRNGSGWHNISNVEYSALDYLSKANKDTVFGNTKFGLDRAGKSVKRIDGLTAGTPTSEILNDARNKTGAGYSDWMLNAAYNTVSDLAGNMTQFSGGVRINRGEIQVMPDNNWAGLGIIGDINDNSKWHYIDGATGNLIPINYTGTDTYWMYDYIAAENSVRITSQASTTAKYCLKLTADATSAFNSYTNLGSLVVSDNALNYLKKIGILMPHTDYLARFNLVNPTTAGSHICLRGISALGQSGGVDITNGIGRLSVSVSISAAHKYYGGRVCFIDI